MKIHTQLDLRGPIPTCIHLTNARQHDVLWLDELVLEPGAFYVMDPGYMDFPCLGLMAAAAAFFVTRAKDNLRFTRHRSLPTDAATGVPGTLHRTLQLLSVHPFEKVPLLELFTETEFSAPPNVNSNQLWLLDL